MKQNLILVLCFNFIGFLFSKEKPPTIAIIENDSIKVELCLKKGFKKYKLSIKTQSLSSHIFRSSFCYYSKSENFYNKKRKMSNLNELLGDTIDPPIDRESISENQRKLYREKNNFLPSLGHREWVDYYPPLYDIYNPKSTNLINFNFILLDKERIYVQRILTDFDKGYIIYIVLPKYEKWKKPELKYKVMDMR